VRAKLLMLVAPFLRRWTYTRVLEQARYPLFHFVPISALLQFPTACAADLLRCSRTSA
jgi:hypothetical protein